MTWQEVSLDFPISTLALPLVTPMNDTLVLFCGEDSTLRQIKIEEQKIIQSFSLSIPNMSNLQVATTPLESIIGFCGKEEIADKQLIMYNERMFPYFPQKLFQFIYIKQIQIT